MSQQEINAQDPCPCGSQEDNAPRAYAQCCGPIHRGGVAPTPEALMRSRYSAFVLHNGPYLLESWAETTRPSDLEFDVAQQWTRLRILSAPEAVDGLGEVHFRAHYKWGTERDFLEEKSRFIVENGRWVYLDGEIIS